MEQKNGLIPGIYQTLRYYLAIYSRDEYELKSVFSIDHRLFGVYKDELYFIENEDPDHFQIGIYELKNLE